MELALCAAFGPIICGTAVGDAGTAWLHVANQSHGDRTYGCGDAFRHAYWSGLIAFDLFPWIAERFGTAHEWGQNPNSLDTRMICITLAWGATTGTRPCCDRASTEATTVHWTTSTTAPCGTLREAAMAVFTFMHRVRGATSRASGARPRYRRVLGEREMPGGMRHRPLPHGLEAWSPGTEHGRPTFREDQRADHFGAPWDWIT
jgi:hypothetical protein